MSAPVAQAQISSTGYVARPHFMPFHRRSQRFSALVCHRRAGKTVACVNELVARAILTKKANARYAYMAPLYRQAKDVAWMYLKDAVRDIAVAIRESELRVILPNGSWITLYGADNPDSLRGLYLDGVVIDEYGDCRPGLWGEVILPTLSDRKGWAVFIGTPKGNNHFKKQYDKTVKDGGFTMMLQASVSGILPPEELSIMRKEMTDEEWEQEMECSFQAALRGAFYGDLMAAAQSSGRIRSVPYDPQFPVNVATDLGFTDSTSMWFWQVVPNGINIISYEEHHSKALPYYFELLDGKGYKEYGTIWLPHDARARTLQTGKSTVEQFLEQVDKNGDRKYPIRIGPKLDIQDGINASKKVIPLCSFDEVSTYEGVECLKAYRRDWDPMKQTLADSPRHDWTSHGSDAFRYLALATELPLMDDEVVVEDLVKPRPMPVIKGLQEITLEELFEMNEKPKLSLVSRRRI